MLNICANTLIAWAWLHEAPVLLHPSYLAICVACCEAICEAIWEAMGTLLEFFALFFRDRSALYSEGLGQYIFSWHRSLGLFLRYCSIGWLMILFFYLGTMSPIQLLVLSHNLTCLCSAWSEIEKILLLIRMRSDMASNLKNVNNT